MFSGGTIGNRKAQARGTHEMQWSGSAEPGEEALRFLES